MEIKEIIAFSLSVISLVASVFTLLRSVRMVRSAKLRIGKIKIEFTNSAGEKRDVLLSPSDEKSVVEFLDAVKDASDER